MISVCIATYNGEKYIKEQILSILAQLSTKDEIIISDDGSTDHTITKILEISSPIIKIVYNQNEHGYTANFENALKNAKGNFIFLSDQDDIWEPNKVACCMEHFKKYDFIISDATIIDANNHVLAPSFYKKRRSKPGLFNNLLRFSYLGCCLAFKKEILQRALPFPKDHKMCTHDNWLTIIGMRYYNSIIIPDKLIRYRRYDSNTSSGGLQKTTTFLFKIKYRLYIIYWLLQRKNNQLKGV